MASGVMLTPDSARKVSEAVGRVKDTPLSMRSSASRFRSRGAGLDFSKFAFGFIIAGPIVTVIAGDITWGKTTYEIDNTDIEITADLQYIGLECSWSAAAVIGPSTSKATFASDDTTKRLWLYRFNFQAGVGGAPGTVTLDKIGKPLGNWDIGSEFAQP